jgi:hypothetical protein
MKPTLTGFLPCVPAPTVWTGFLASVEIGSGNALVDSSTIQCAIGGCISYQNSGQMKPNKMVTNPSSPLIDALKKAAINGTPFVEIPDQKEPVENPKIIRIYWMDEQDDEPHEVHELKEGQEVTLCVEVEEGGEGETVDVEITDTQGRKFKNGETSLKFENLTVEFDNTAYVDNFSFEFEKI